MFESIFDDLKHAIRSGNMMTRIILLNVGVFVLLNLIAVFSGGFSSSLFLFFKENLSISSQFIEILRHPWTIVTHMFTHLGLFHVGMNMLMLYWFGRIVGDFLGDERFLPLYILGGLFGALVYVLTAQFLPSAGAGSYAFGASAAVMGFVFVAASLSPDYQINLVFIGPVKLKWIAVVLLFLDIIGTIGSNSGGAFGHIGGAIFGMVYVYYLRQNIDFTKPLQNFFAYFDWSKENKRTMKPKSEFIKVVHKDLNKPKPAKKSGFIYDQKRIDSILDKINKEGYDSLSSEEKEILYNASKK